MGHDAKRRKSHWTVVQIIPNLGTGGAERSTLEVARALAFAGHRSVVISGGGRWVKRLTRSGSEHIKLPVGVKSLLIIVTLLRLRQQLKALAPDLIHVRSRLPAWLVKFALWGLSPRPALVSTVHGLNSVSAYSRILTRADRVIAVSNTTRDYLLRHYPKLDPECIRVIPRGADPAEFSPATVLTGDWRGQFYSNFPMLAKGVLLTLPGRGTRLKGHADAIKLLARVRAAGIDARLLLLGVVEDNRLHYLHELQSLADEMGVADFLALSAARSDIREIYAISDLILQLSTHPESFGRVVAEALCMGKPVLGYDHGGVGELLKDFYPAGRAPLGNLDALTERAKALLRNAPPVDNARVPKVADLQRLTLSVYAELLEQAPPDPAFDAP